MNPPLLREKHILFLKKSITHLNEAYEVSISYLISNKCICLLWIFRGFKKFFIITKDLRSIYNDGSVWTAADRGCVSGYCIHLHY